MIDFNEETGCFVLYPEATKCISSRRFQSLVMTKILDNYNKHQGEITRTAEALTAVT